MSSFKLAILYAGCVYFDYSVLCLKLCHWYPLVKDILSSVSDN